MIEECPFCELRFGDCVCEKRKMRSNMIDSSIFIGAYDEGSDSEECEMLLKGALKKTYLGNVSTIIHGEILKKLLRLKKEVNYRYNSIREDILEKLLHFRILYICEGTIEEYNKLNIRGKSNSQDRINLACAIRNKCNLYIMKDSAFTYNQKKNPTSIVQITDKKNEILKDLLNEIKSR